MKKYILTHQETSVTPLTLGINHRGFHHRLHYGFTKPIFFKSSFIAYKNYQVDWYCDWENFRDLADIIIARIKKSNKFSQRLLWQMESIGGKLLAVNKKILGLDLSVLDNKFLASLLNRIYNLGCDICDLGAVAVFPDLRHYKLSTLLKNIINEKIEKYSLKRGSNDYFTTLITPYINSVAIQERLSVFKLAIKINKNSKLHNLWNNTPVDKLTNKIKVDYPQFYKELISLEHNYCWSAFGHLGPVRKMEDYINDIKRSLKDKNVEKQYNNLLNHVKYLKKIQQQYFIELKLNTTEKRLFLSARDFSHSKVYRFDVLLNTWYVLDKLLFEISKRVKFSVKELRFMSTEEIIGLLSGKTTVTTQNIKDRQKYCVVVIAGSKVKHLTGRVAADYIKKYATIEKTNKGVTTFHGSVAFVGQVTGPAKIVNSVKDIGKVQHGDILISIQTNPDLLPAMRRAAAFVTDIGGITSHAAIVAREMKKPCIIGTKIASKVIHDGDLVEVDAVKGNLNKL